MLSSKAHLLAVLALAVFGMVVFSGCAANVGGTDYSVGTKDGKLAIGEKAVCGNKIVEKTEQCEKDDDCGTVKMECRECQCYLKEKYKQEEENAAKAKPVCGNGKLEADEACEKGVKECAEGKICNSACVCEAKREAAAQPSCGNAKLEGAEECEKGMACKGEGKVCNENRCVCEQKETPVCGNGKKEGQELCEKGVPCANADEVCSEASCTCKKKEAPAAPVCGNGKLDGGEQCDMGTKASPASNACPSGQYCSACKCYTAAQPISCKANDAYKKDTGLNNFMYTTLPVCQDDCRDIYGKDWKCDLTTCTCIPRSVTSATCGNNKKEMEEECDGIDNAACGFDEICGSACKCVNGTQGVCGNNVREGNEQCDGTDKAACAAGSVCGKNCLCAAAPAAVCGNNVREGNEQCDGADRGVCAANQVCGNACVCAAAPPAAVCGNNVREGTEACDGTDRGTCTSAQTCGANCACVAQQQAVCGNNVREGNEQCDGIDRAACSSGQTCNQNCACQNVQVQQTCGNNVKEGTEQCDGSDRANCGANYTCGANCACVCSDRDADGVCDVNDNCVSVNNPGQGDRDGDGIGDACDAVPVSCTSECSAIGKTAYAQGENNRGVCDAKIQADSQAAMNGLGQNRECFTTCRYANSTSGYLTITMNQVSYGCCCIGATNAWKVEHACTDCPGQNPVCPDPDDVC